MRSRRCLSPLTDRYFQNGQVFDLESVYKEVVVLEKEQLEDLKKDVVEKFRRAEDSLYRSDRRRAGVFTEICPDLPVEL